MPTIFASEKGFGLKTGKAPDSAIATSELPRIGAWVAGNTIYLVGEISTQVTIGGSGYAGNTIRLRGDYPGHTANINALVNAVYCYGKNNIEISGLSIQSSTGHGIFIRSSTGIRVLGNEIGECKTYGIRLSGCFDFSVTDNMLVNERLGFAGIHVEGCSDFLIEDNDVQERMYLSTLTPLEFTTGILVTNANNMSRKVVKGNRVNVNGDGIVVSSTSNNTITTGVEVCSNIIKDSGDGIAIYSADFNDVHDNTVVHSKRNTHPCFALEDYRLSGPAVIHAPSNNAVHDNVFILNATGQKQHAVYLWDIGNGNTFYGNYTYQTELDPYAIKIGNGTATSLSFEEWNVLGHDVH